MGGKEYVGLLAQDVQARCQRVLFGVKLQTTTQQQDLDDVRSW